MNKAIVLLLLLLFCQMAPAQTYLEKLAEWNGIEINLPEGVTASQNEESFLLCPIDDDNPYPTIPQYYKFERCQDGVYFNASLGLIDNLLENNQKDYKVIVDLPAQKRIPAISPKALDSDIDELVSCSNAYLDLGSNTSNVEDHEIYQMRKMVKIYPETIAKEYFNATAIVSFPMSFQHNVLYGKYTHGKIVSVRNKKTDTTFSLIFLMTDDNYTRFDEFLKDFKGAFRFTDAPISSSRFFQ